MVGICARLDIFIYQSKRSRAYAFQALNYPFSLLIGRGIQLYFPMA